MVLHKKQDIYLYMEKIIRKLIRESVDVNHRKPRLIKENEDLSEIKSLKIVLRRIW